MIFTFFLSRLERAKKLQEQKEKEMFEKQQQQQQEIAAGEKHLLCQVLKLSRLSQDAVTYFCVVVFFQLLPLLQLLLLQQQQLPQTLASMWQPFWPLGHRLHHRLLWQRRWQLFKQKHWQRLVLLCPATTTRPP